ncbi:PDZ domain-containing protein [Rubritalea squalenifaciens DSM 18772]|uniref:PDZ domain-containing protein n=1 Tax=Rubritalea squalenifaciens DSM 18772 TaxID=1123071 RepID=A0A1M6LNR9_9BACT|nr:PDZ domain-containing protein [Rubritalea squalenifaciens]SHJ72805.1 PDZ domain-containing protein [Rubritalea squalenifaciens DSM 18772]
MKTSHKIALTLAALSPMLHAEEPTIQYTILQDGSVALQQVQPGDATYYAAAVQLDDASSQRLIIGVNTSEIDQRLKQQLGIDSGVLVEQVAPGMPAAKAGIMAGDIITAIDQTKINKLVDITSLTKKHKPEDTLQLTYLRSGKQSTVSVSLHEVKPATPQPTIRLNAIDSKRLVMGVAINEIEPKLKQHLGIQSGVIIDSVSPGLPADKAGLQAGDIITSVNQVPTDKLETIISVLQRLKADDTVQVEYLREGNKSLATVALKEISTNQNAMTQVIPKSAMFRVPGIEQEMLIIESTDDKNNVIIRSAKGEKTFELNNQTQFLALPNQYRKILREHQLVDENGQFTKNYTNIQDETLFSLVTPDGKIQNQRGRVIPLGQANALNWGTGDSEVMVHSGIAAFTTDSVTPMVIQNQTVQETLLKVLKEKEVANAEQLSKELAKALGPVFSLPSARPQENE